MQTILYTDTDQVRSVLGIDESDMSDAQITDRNLTKELRLDLVSWLPTHATLYTTGVGAGDATEDLSDAIALYCTYFCAVLVATSMQMAAPQKVSDGKNSMERFLPMDWQKILASLHERMATYRKLVQDLSSQQVLVTSPKLFSGVGLAVDPVTGA